jgi:hypothetical protein
VHNNNNDRTQHLPKRGHTRKAAPPATPSEELPAHLREEARRLWRLVAEHHQPGLSRLSAAYRFGDLYTVLEPEQLYPALATDSERAIARDLLRAFCSEMPSRDPSQFAVRSASIPVLHLEAVVSCRRAAVLHAEQQSLALAADEVAA